jgi:hypothetical protein
VKVADEGRGVANDFLRTLHPCCCRPISAVGRAGGWRPHRRAGRLRAGPDAGTRSGTRATRPQSGGRGHLRHVGSAHAAGWRPTDRGWPRHPAGAPPAAFRTPSPTCRTNRSGQWVSSCRLEWRSSSPSRRNTSHRYGGSQQTPKSCSS